MSSALSEPPQRVELERRRPTAPSTSSCATAPRSTCDPRSPATSRPWPRSSTGCRPRRAGFASWAAASPPTRAARRLIDHGVGLVATAGADGHVVAHACFVPEPTAERAELAFAVADAWQGRGIGTLMLAHLAQLAEAAGVVTLTAFVHPDNHRMLGVLRDSGFAMDVRAEPGLLEIELPAQLSAAARERFEERDRTAAVAAVRHVLEPASIAVVGASRRQGSVGGTVVRNLVAAGFAGPVYPINPHAQTIAGRPAYAVAGRCAHAGGAGHHRRRRARRARRRARVRDRGVPALVVLSAGFGEAGAEGRARQAELLGICRETGMRLVGPNCLGVLNTAPAVRMNATFAPGRPPAGTDRLRLAERRLRHRRARAVRAARPRALVVRLDGRQGRPVGQRLPALLGAGPGHRRRAAVPRVAGQPAALRPDRAAADGLQARHRGQERTDGRGTASGVVAHRRAAGGLRGHRRRALRPRRRDPRRDARRAARRRRAARAPAAARRQSRRDRDQRRRPGDRLRRRVRRRRPARRAAAGRHPPGPARAAAAGGGAWRTPSTCSPPRRAATSAARSRRSPPTPGSTRSSRSSSRRCRAAGCRRCCARSARRRSAPAATASRSRPSSWPPARRARPRPASPTCPSSPPRSTPRARSGTRRDTRIAAAIRRRPPSRRPTSTPTAPRR